MVKDYLNALKTKGNFTNADISKLSGIPEPTVRKILSGETEDPRFETILKLVTSMGGSMDDIGCGKKEAEIENNAVMVLKEAYEARIEALRERLADTKNYAESLNRDKKMLGIVVLALGLLLVGLLVFDIALDSNGWLQH